MDQALSHRTVHKAYRAKTPVDLLDYFDSKPPGLKGGGEKNNKKAIQQSPTLPFLSPAARTLASSPGYSNNLSGLPVEVGWSPR